MRREVVDEILATEFAGGATAVAAAETAGVSERTARRRLDDAAFRARVRERRAELFEEANARTVGAARQAAELLTEVLEYGGDEALRVRVALAVLTHARTAITLDAVHQRLEVLESFVQALDTEVLE